MAVAVASLIVDPHPYGVDNTQRRQIINGTCVLSGPGVNTYPVGGVPLPWNQLGDSTGRFIPQSAASQPVAVSFFSKTGGSFNYSYTFDQVNNKLRIQFAGAELGQYAISADTIGFKAEYVRGV